MSYFHDPEAPRFRVRYIGWKRPGWFKKPEPTWVVEAYGEFHAPMPEQDSIWGYREMSRWTSQGNAHLELSRFKGEA